MDYLSSEETAYLAGFFDGEGCIGTQMDKSGNVCVTIAVSQVDKRPLGLFVGRFGGAIARTIHKQSEQPIYTWRTGKKEHVIDLLTSLLPYLIVKSEQAVLALELVNTVGRNGASVPAHIKERRQYLSQQIKTAKLRVAVSL